MARYIDEWRVHVRLSKFHCAPHIKNASGDVLGCYNANKDGNSHMFFRPNGLWREDIPVYTHYRGNFGSMYPKTMK